MTNMSIKLKITLPLVILLTISFSKVIVYANIPTISEVTSQDNDTIKLIVKASHSSPSSNHYVDEAQVDIDGSVKTFSLTAQSSTSFSLNLPLNISQANSIKVRVHCNQHGWSGWSNLKSGEPPPEEPGIPGYPVEALIIGLLIAIYIARTR